MVCPNAKASRVPLVMTGPGGDFRTGFEAEPGLGRPWMRRVEDEQAGIQDGPMVLEARVLEAAERQTLVVGRLVLIEKFLATQVAVVGGLVETIRSLMGTGKTMSSAVALDQPGEAVNARLDARRPGWTQSPRRSWGTPRLACSAAHTRRR